MLYMALLTHFILFPPRRGDEASQAPTPDFREVLLIVYSASKMSQPWSIRTTPYIFLVLAFVSCFPTVTFPDDFAYSILLFVFSWNVLELHLPQPPSPVYLFPLPQTLSLATIAWHGLSRIFFPVLAFFLPAFLLSMFLLSTSLSDIIPMIFLGDPLRPAPMESRIAFVTLMALLFLLMLCTLAMLVLVYPFLSSTDNSTSPWDRYSVSVGLEARRLFVCTVAKYAAPYVFPAPFNLIQLVVVRIPRMLFIVLGGTGITQYLHTAEVTIWRVFITPLTSILAGMYTVVDFADLG